MPIPLYALFKLYSPGARAEDMGLTVSQRIGKHMRPTSEYGPMLQTNRLIYLKDLARFVGRQGSLRRSAFQQVDQRGCSSFSSLQPVLKRAPTEATIVA